MSHVYPAADAELGRGRIKLAADAAHAMLAKCQTRVPARHLQTYFLGHRGDACSDPAEASVNSVASASCAWTARSSSPPPTPAAANARRNSFP
jgi:hypothetical protein